MAKLCTATTKKPQNIEDILEAVGDFGNFQIFILILLLFLEIPTAFLVLVPVFIGASPKEWLCNNETISKSLACSCNGTLTALDPTFSVVSEWGLVCDQAWVSDTVTSLQMIGMLFGNLLVSQLSDWYGRRYSYLGISLTMALASIATTIAPNAYVYAVARFFCGAGFSGFLSLNAVYTIEFMTPKYRGISAAYGPFGEGIMLLSLLAYYIRPWRLLMWATVIPFAAIFIIFPLIPESPRWLLRNQKLDQLEKVLASMARMNGREPISSEVIRHVADKDQIANVLLPMVNGKQEIEKLSFLEFFWNPDLRKTTFFLGGIWFTWGLVYFGIGYNIKNFPGNIYLNVALMGLADSIGFPSSLSINNRLGRRRALVVFMTFAAIFFGAIAVLDLTKTHVSVTILAALCLLGRYGMAGARSAARTLCGESFPTPLRVMGIGLTGSMAGIGGALGPQLVYIGDRWPAVPFLAFAILSVGGSVISFALKETKGQPLQEQVISRKQSRAMSISVEKFHSNLPIVLEEEDFESCPKF